MPGCGCRIHIEKGDERDHDGVSQEAEPKTLTQRGGGYAEISVGVKKTKREKNLSAFRTWMDHKLIDADVSEKSLAEQINRSPRMFSQYKATGKWPFEQMAVLLGLLDATDEEIVQVVKWWQ